MNSKQLTMHYRFLATFNKEFAESSKSARSYTANYLMDNGFIYQDTRWSSGYADWFVIGGRWSGELQLLQDRFWKEIDKNKDIETSDIGFSVQEAKKKEKELQKIWKDMGGKGLNPYARDTYSQEGYEDDAMVVTKEIYDKLLKQYKGSEESEHHADFDYEPVSKEFIGKKWIVVVDYHT